MADLLLSPYGELESLASIDSTYQRLEIKKKCFDSLLWRLVHVLLFATGGIMFIFGTWMLYKPERKERDWAVQDSAVLFIIGSLGFLAVRVLEFFTFTDDKLLRVHIALSAIGSGLYVAGSVGFLPIELNKSAMLCEWGFILGSILIGTSQFINTLRLMDQALPEDEDTADGGPFPRRFSSLFNLCSSLEVFTAASVELSTGVGAWCFFVGMLLYKVDSIKWDFEILAWWIVGASFFTLSAIFLAYRHFVLCVT